jgi:hypothetical protein
MLCMLAVTWSTDVQHRPNRFASAGAKTKQLPTQTMGDFGIAAAAMPSGGEACLLVQF